MIKNIPRQYLDYIPTYTDFHKKDWLNFGRKNIAETLVL